MTISIWRYSHLALAISSFLLLVLASVTGIILAFQPLSEKLQPYKSKDFSNITLAQSLPILQQRYPGITTLTVDANQFVLINGSDTEGKKLKAYVDPQTAIILGSPKEKNSFFQWITGFHRSLFLHDTGRFFIGLTAFLLSLITLSGTVLIIQRQRGVKRFFKRIVRDNFAQYYHVVLGRWSIIPILILSVTGTYLSLSKFGLVNIQKPSHKIDFDAIRSTPAKKEVDFNVFKNIKLKEVESIDFPFSEDVEDYYTLKLRDREIAVNQMTGDVLAEVKYPVSVSLIDLSLNLHTGRASAVWAVILAFASANILFFIYSGFAITLKRRKNRAKNKFTADESRFIILVGSENGTTYRFAQVVHQQLLKGGERSYVTELNNYTFFPNADYIFILTATYGLGDAPTNATKFIRILEKYPQSQPVRYCVLGFGSKAYPDFCKFAFEVNNLLSMQSWAQALIDVHTVNDKSPADFNLWAEAWSQQTGIALPVLSDMDQIIRSGKLEKLQVKTSITSTHIDGAFSICLQPRKKLKVRSGDLLAIYPENDHRERLYSIGLVDEEIRLSVRPHIGGIGSSYLQRLKSGDYLHARIVDNDHFHFPNQASEVIMISNGTGIAPFLGMISQNINRIPCHLYCGFRDHYSLEMYRSILEKGQLENRLRQFYTAFSREGEKQYVSDLILRDAKIIVEFLKSGGVLMICGSLAMQKDIFDLLGPILEEESGKDISYYQSRQQIKTDCY